MTDPVRMGAGSEEVAQLGDIAAAAGLRRIAILAWRDIDDPEAGGSEIHASRVAALWEELAASSPSAALVSEGRIVMAGSLADRGRLRDAVAMLERRGADVRRPAEHHLRVWYALADLFERSGDMPRARELFDRVRRSEATFADVAERLLALG